jgi:outer membrane protein OmpA-like peptidoglycan-associated protein/Tol biopolymer transport system component
MKQLLTFCFLMGSLSLLAQRYNPEQVKPAAQAEYGKAVEKIQDGDLSAAMQLVEAALKLDPNFVDAYLSLGGLNAEKKQYKKAVELHTAARKIDSAYCIEYNLPFAQALCGAGEFEKAAVVVAVFLQQPNLKSNAEKLGNKWKRSIDFALDWKAKHSNDQYVFSPFNLGDSVNTKDSEYFPSVSVDGKELVFTRRLNNFNEDFYATQQLPNAGWSKARSLSGKINTENNEGAQCVSLDGEWLIFTGCNFEGGLGSCDLWISYKTPQGWSEPENMGEAINTEFWESAPSLSPDKKDLYFASRRPGSLGAADIYVSHRLPNGRWGKAENLGESVNTKGEESSPFIHADNQTLYFLSDGHIGYGNTDLYLMRKDDNATWQAPVNLGYPINTVDAEGSLVVSADGKTAYYTSDRTDSRGGLDLYRFDLRKDIQPVQSFYVKGKVYDKKTNAGLPCTVELIDQANNRTLMQVQTDETGNYLMTLPTGKNYAFVVNRKGYLFYSDVYALANNSFDSIYQKNIPLQPIEVKSSMVMKHILFENNQFTLLPVSMVELDKMVQLLQQNPTVKILVKGHTDNNGKAKDNQKLSTNRAQAVVTYLLQKGIEKTRLQFKGLGATQPIADNKTLAGKALNRRTEIEITAK